MKQESHRLLGYHLIDLLEKQPNALHTRAFLIGCVEPDRNPFTYLKGSIRSRWFYGHNYQNSNRWIERHISALLRKDHWNAWNYYCMGKLIHYTADAFTYVHNNCFTESIAAHRAYENLLQEQFLQRMHEREYIRQARRDDIIAFFQSSHQHYLERRQDVQQDCQYILSMCDYVFNQLFPEASPAI